MHARNIIIVGIFEDAAKQMFIKVENCYFLCGSLALGDYRDKVYKNFEHECFFLLFSLFLWN